MTLKTYIVTRAFCDSKLDRYARALCHSCLLTYRTRTNTLLLFITKKRRRAAFRRTSTALICPDARWQSIPTSMPTPRMVPLMLRRLTLSILKYGPRRLRNHSMQSRWSLPSAFQAQTYPLALTLTDSPVKSKRGSLALVAVKIM